MSSSYVLRKSGAQGLLDQAPARLQYLSAMVSRALAATLGLSLLGTFVAPAASAEETSETLGTREHPLEPPDTSSPRATVETFLNDARDGWRYYLKNGRQRLGAYRQALHCLDLSEVPPALRDDVGLEAGIQLYDVFNRIPLPPLGDVPDAEEMERQGLIRWLVPHTPIAIARVAEGERTGEWLFTPETVRRAEEFHRATRHLPVKPGAVVDDGLGLLIVESGPMIPDHWIGALPIWAKRVYYEQTIWQWGLLILVLVLAGLLAWLGIRWSRRAALGERSSARRALVGPISLGLLSWGTVYLLDEQVNITGALQSALQTVLHGLSYLAAVWGAWLAGRLVVRSILLPPHTRSAATSRQLVGLGARLTTLAIVFLIAGMWARSLGLPVIAVITGLGVGGIAVALGAQKTMENLFGALMLFGDRPVNVGDVCRFGDKVGIVERIGLRSTRVRTPEQSVVTVSNGEFSSLQLEKLSPDGLIPFHAVLKLRQDTTTEQLRRVRDRVDEILTGHAAIDEDQVRVRFRDVGPDSLDVSARAYVNTRDWGEFHVVQEKLLMEILRAVDEAGAALATPERIVHLRPSEEAVTERANDPPEGA